MNPGALAEQLREAAELLEAHAPATDTLRMLHQVGNAIDTEQARLVAELTTTDEHRAEGSSSIKNWLRSHLHLDASEASRLISAGRVLRDLPEVAEAAADGRIRSRHVNLFGFALRHIEAEIVVDSQTWLLDVASTSEPGRLRDVIRGLREALYPDELDQAWIDGMARRDITCSPVPDGWHVKGFLPITVGATLHALLGSLSAPTGAQDDRPAAARRVDGLDELLSRVLDHGLPSDGGARPHVSVFVDADELRRDADTAGDHDSAAAPAHLAGFGSIGRRTFEQIMCDADLTPLLTAGRHSTLDVGATLRLATPAQRRAVNAQQGGQCAAPGCAAPVVHVHHVVWFSHGGPTDLVNLIGLCPGCHTLVHQERLRIDPDTHAFSRRNAPPLRENPSNHYHRRRAAHDRIRRSLRQRRQAAPAA